MLPWSVIARAGILCEAMKRIRSAGLPLSSTMRQAPSKREYSVWACKCTNDLSAMKHYYTKSLGGDGLGFKLGAVGREGLERFWAGKNKKSSRSRAWNAPTLCRGGIPRFF